MHEKRKIDIPNTSRSYLFWNRVTKKEAEQIFAETGYHIEFPNNATEVKHVIGGGNFGKLRLAYDVSRQQVVCVKKIKQKNNNLFALQESINERIIHQKINDLPDILHLFDSVVTEDSKRGVAIYQFEELGLNNNDKLIKWVKTFDERHLLLRHLAHRLLRGIDSLHKRNIAHFDMTTANWLMMKNGAIKIIDFGLAQELPSPIINKFVNGNMPYFSPERIAFERGMQGTVFSVSEKVSQYNAYLSDAWSVGVTLLEAILSYPPLSLASKNDRLNFWDSKKYDAFLQDAYEDPNFLILAQMDPTIAKLVKGLLAVDPSNRLTAESALALCKPLSDDEIRKLVEIVQANMQKPADVGLHIELPEVIEDTKLLPDSDNNNNNEGKQETTNEQPSLTRVYIRSP